SALAAKAATTSIPILFSVGADPVQFGLVASLNRPGGNLTGANWLVGELGAKGLALLHEVVPGAATIGFLENPNNPVFELLTRDVLAAATVLGPKVQVLKASTQGRSCCCAPQSGQCFIHRVPVTDRARLYRQNPQRCEARRPASGAVDQIRVCDQPSNCAIARHRGAPRGALHRR